MYITTPIGIHTVAIKQILHWAIEQFLSSSKSECTGKTYLVLFKKFNLVKQIILSTLWNNEVKVHFFEMFLPKQWILLTSIKYPAGF